MAGGAGLPGWMKLSSSKFPLRTRQHYSRFAMYISPSPPVPSPCPIPHLWWQLAVSNRSVFPGLCCGHRPTPIWNIRGWHRFSGDSRCRQMMRRWDAWRYQHQTNSSHPEPDSPYSSIVINNVSPLLPSLSNLWWQQPATGLTCYDHRQCRRCDSLHHTWKIMDIYEPATGEVNSASPSSL